ncbi:MAG: LysR family transcriptional regulator [Methylobacteriaceae bacterium]|nr:LysR family transcriptional regulator [Methylobacteriaceae bacterium]
MGDLDPKLLRAFAAILDARGVSAAARREGVSQPTMSGHVRRLREHFADPLFAGHGPSFRVTRRAEAAAVHVRAALEALDALSGPRWPSGTRRFRLVASGYVQSLLLSRLDAALGDAPGPVALEVVGGLAEAGGDWDVAIAPGERLAPHWRSRHAFSDRLVALLGPREDIPLSLERFCALDHVLVAPAPSPVHDAVDRALAALGRRRHVARVVPPSVDLAPLIIGQRRLAMLPGRAGPAYADRLVVAEPPIDLEPIRFRLAWRAETQADPGARWFRDVVGSACHALR